MGGLSHILRSGSLLAAILLLAGCVTTSFQTQKSLPPETEQRRIVVLPPDVELSILHGGGINEPQAEWTANARRHIDAHLDDHFRAINARLVRRPEDNGPVAHDRREEQLLKLHEVVGKTILVHQYPGPLQLPTKAVDFEWSLGPETAYLHEKYGADYALFCFVRDSYSSDSRKAVIILAALLFGAHVPGGTQIGFASLVDLRTGEVVWFNRLLRATGDLREAAAARETVTLLLSSFPQ